jgi:hypothetical protein
MHADETSNQPKADVPEPAVWRKLVALMVESFWLVKNLAELAGLEMRVAVQTLPKLVALSFGLIFICALTWISLCLCLSWLAYRVVGDIGAGLLCFFVIQLATLAMLFVLFKRYQRRLTLPTSCAQMTYVAQSLRTAFAAAIAKTGKTPQ